MAAGIQLAQQMQLLRVVPESVKPDGARSAIICKSYKLFNPAIYEDQYKQIQGRKRIFFSVFLGVANPKASLLSNEMNRRCGRLPKLAASLGGQHVGQKRGLLNAEHTQFCQ